MEPPRSSQEITAAQAVLIAMPFREFLGHPLASDNMAVSNLPVTCGSRPSKWKQKPGGRPSEGPGKQKPGKQKPRAVGGGLAVEAPEGHLVRVGVHCHGGCNNKIAAKSVEKSESLGDVGEERSVHEVPPAQTSRGNSRLESDGQKYFWQTKTSGRPLPLCQILFQ